MGQVRAGSPVHRATPRWSQAVCIASGPSLTADDCERVRQWRRPGRGVIVVNTSFRLAGWADVLYAADAKWWRLNRGEALAFAGEKWTCSGEPAKLPGVTRIEPRFGIGLCRDPRYLHTGGNSGYQAVNLAFHFGARRIILLGYDMQHTGGRRHWHEDYPAQTPKGDRMDNASNVAGWCRRFEPLARDLAREGVQVLNATWETALTCFPRVTLPEALCAP